MTNIRKLSDRVEISRTAGREARRSGNRRLPVESKICMDLIKGTTNAEAVVILRGWLEGWDGEGK